MMNLDLNFILTVLLMGGAWIVSMFLLFTRFYGMQIKENKHTMKRMTVAYLVYIVVGIALQMALNNRNSIGIANLLLWLFLVGYWFFNIYGVKVAKKLCIFFFAFSFISCVQDVTAAVANVFLKVDTNVQDNEWNQIVYILLYTGMIAFVSWISGRKRKEMMRFSLMISLFVLNLFATSLMSVFDLNEDNQEMKVFRIGLNISKEALNSQFVKNGATVIIFIIVIMMILLVIRESEAYYFNRKNTINEYYLETQKKHYESLMESNREIRKIKHDMKNHIYCMQSISQKGNIDELNEYLNGLGKKLEQADVSVHTGNEIADAILSEKMRVAKEREIQVMVEGDLSGLAMTSLDLCTILSNMMDNAIEAVEQLENQDQRKIEVSIRKNNHFLFICEKNPSNGLVSIMNNGVNTTKKNHEQHGFGITNIKEAAYKYDGEVVLSSQETDGGYEFIMEVMIPC